MSSYGHLFVSNIFTTLSISPKEDIPVDINVFFPIDAIFLTNGELVNIGEAIL